MVLGSQMPHVLGHWFDTNGSWQGLSRAPVYCLMSRRHVPVPARSLQVVVAVAAMVVGGVVANVVLMAHRCLVSYL